MKTAPRIICCGIAILAAAALGACGGSSSSAPAADTPADTTSVSNAVPSDVVIASPTASTTASANIAAKSLRKAFAGDAAGESYEDKKAAVDELRAGTGTCGFTPSLDIPTMPECYGPQVNYTNHPGGEGMMGNQLPVKDVGFWNATEGADSEACAAAQMNFLIKTVSTRVDMALNMFNNMVCVGKQNNLELPAVGATTDLKAALGEKGPITGVTLNTATIERLADDSDGNPVYKSSVNITLGDRTLNAILKHIKTGDGTYKGKLSMTMTNASEMGMGGFSNCNGAAAGSVHAAVVKYAKASSTSVVYEMNFAEFCGANATPLDSDNNIARTNAFDPVDNLTGWGNDWNYGLFDLNPTNGTGTVAYAWQAGAADARTRTLNATVTEAADGTASGTAYYGYGAGVDGTDALGVIEGFICNWAGPDGAISGPVGDAAKTHAALVAAGKEVNAAQKQTLTRAAGGTVFTPATSNITYAPSNNCNKAAPNLAFTFMAVTSGPSGTPLNQDNDITDATTVTNNLIDIGEITTNFTLPTPPTDVGG